MSAGSSAQVLIPPQPLPFQGPKRTSSLDAPIMLLEGHDSAVFTLKFNPTGDVVASGSHDKFVFLWNVRGECENFMMLKGHKNAILELHWTTDGERLLTASPDKTIRAWDAQTGLQANPSPSHLCLPCHFAPSLCPIPSHDGSPLL